MLVDFDLSKSLKQISSYGAVELLICDFLIVSNSNPHGYPSTFSCYSHV